MSADDHRGRWGLRGPALGVAVGGASTPDDWQRALRWVERADELGLHSVWVPEMHFAPGVSASPLIALAAFAARSRRLRLGTTSLLLPIHDPERLAAEVAALDRLSGGRVILGLGRGFRRPLFEVFGVDASAKRDRFDEHLDRMLERWRDDDPPHQSPHPPLAVAAFGPKGLAQAARRGLPYLASPLEPMDQVGENLARHREGLPAEVDPASLVVVVMRTAFVASDDGEAGRVREALEKETRAIRGRVPRSLERAAAAGVDQRALVGTAGEVRDRLAGWREQLGLDLLIARPDVAGATPSARRASLERLAEIIAGA